MSKQREALKLALDTLRGWIGIDEWIWPVTAKETCKKNSLEAITAIREALAEPEQEPVAWITGGGQGELWWYQSNKFDDDENLIGPNPDDIPLYTAPPARKPLNDTELWTMWVESPSDVLRFARAIESAHGIIE